MSLADEAHLGAALVGDLRAGEPRALENPAPFFSHVGQERIDALPLKVIEAAISAAHEVEGQRRCEQTKGGSYPGAERRNEGGEMEGFCHPVAVNRPGASKRVEGKTARVFPPLAQ